MTFPPVDDGQGPAAPPVETCKRPSAGGSCSRPAGHDGPCAANPTPQVVIQLDRHRLSPPSIDLPAPPFSWRREPPDLTSLGDVLIDEEGCLVIDVVDDHYSGTLCREDTLALAHAILGTVK